MYRFGYANKRYVRYQGNNIDSLPMRIIILSPAAQGTTFYDAPPCPDPYGIHAYAHPEDCASFFLCTNGSLSYEYCENGLLFDGHGNIHNHCNYNWAVDCGNRKVDSKYKVALSAFFRPLPPSPIYLNLFQLLSHISFERRDSKNAAQRIRFETYV